ncbi:cytochrome P450 [Lysinibacillus endophyticus]|uniref:cytochrome P450 n=1 Tax=Ureibacillus endophyticus TaxID=1978490 RepID=UPI00209E029B|nr:cytochrome P450 [Lysinibacillus endophyticus]MCP1146372.1 cytochrome P450 [Lysinibacillus endophyticus]
MVDNQMPREEGLDHSLSLLKEGYRFIVNRREQLKSDIFETRLLGKKAICLVGSEAAELFYDEDKFQRSDAAPNRIVQTLFGKNSVQTLDGEEHRTRKELLMSVMTTEQINKLLDITELQWEKSLDKWVKMDKIELYEEVKELLCKVAFKWIGAPLHEEEVKTMTKELAAMFESPAAIGPAHWMGRTLRNVIEKIIQQHIQDTREGKVSFPKDSVMHKFSLYKDKNGELLDVETATVEVINMLRPIVAISIYINFTVLALLQYPDQKQKLKMYRDYAKMFVQEVRRFYPFFPFVAAKVKKDFVWNGYHFKEGTLTLLDLYGTNHDPKIWDNPDEFNPERFAHWEGTPFSFIPQGGGDYYLGHRCAGEGITIKLMKIGLDYLVNKMEYEVPEQDLNLELDDIPSIPKSKIILKNIRRVSAQ